MVIVAWIVLISVVILALAHIILLIVNKKYRKKIINICGIIVTIVLLPIFLYTILVSVSVLKQGENFVAYYNPGGREMFYYNDSEYYKITNEQMEKKAVEYGAEHWEDSDMYITDRKIDFPYWEYCLPEGFWDELLVPGNLEPIYLKVWDHWYSEATYYVREDVREQVQ